MKKTTRGSLLACAALLAALAAPRVARAQDRPLAERLLDRVGQTLDAKKDAGLLRELSDRGLVPRGAKKLVVDPALVERVVGNDRYRAALGVRYNVGDQVYVQTNGELHYRGEIAAINPDGSYQVKVWDKLESVHSPDTGKPVDPITGQPWGGAAATRVRHVDANGNTVEEDMLTPWLERPNLREVTIAHDELDRLNGRADPGHGTEYTVNGYVVNLEKDATLKKRVDAAMAAVDELIASGALDLTLPADPAARAAKIESIAAAQREIVTEIFKTNPMGYLRGSWAQKTFAEMQADPAMRLGGRIMVGGVLKYAVGVCSDQTAALASVMREVGRRVGFDVRVIHGAYHGGGHNFMNVHTADGRNFLNDPSWHSQADTPWAALEHVLFGTFDNRHWSDRQINRFGEAVTDPTAFADETARARAATGGVDDATLERLRAVVLTSDRAGTAPAPSSVGVTGLLDARLRDRTRGDAALDR